jgi:hypothetical protein
MRFTGWICSAVLFCTALTAQAQVKADCVSTAEMQEIAQHFTQFKELADKGEYCFDGSQTSHLIAGIMFMRKTQFPTDMPKSPDDLFSGTFKNDWYGYFIGRITDFEVQDDCPNGVIAFVYSFGTTMYVCPAALTDNYTALDRASVFMHEARHIDGFPHMMCTHGPREGMRGACDNKISDEGSYAVTVETYAQISHFAQDLHPALRAYARNSSVVYADEAFENQVKINRKDQFLVLTNDSKFHALDLSGGNTQLKDLGSAPELGHITMRSQHMVIYPDDKSHKARFVFARGEGESQQSAGDLAIEYNKQSEQERAQLVDTHSGAQWNARIFKDKAKLSCVYASKETSDVALAEQPASFIYPDGYDRSIKKALVISESGKIYELGCEDTTPYVRPSELVLDQNYKRIYKMGGDVIGLSRDGRLFRVNGGTSTPLQTAVDGRVYELVPNQQVEFLDRD